MTIFTVILVIIFLLPIDVFAEPPFYLTYKPGMYSPQSGALDIGLSTEVAFGYRFNQNIAAEFGLGYFNTEKEVTAVGATYVVRENFDIDVVPMTLTLKAILPYKRWELFGLAGGGVYIVSGPYDYYYYDYYYYDYEYDDYDAVLGGYLGGGIHYNITPNNIRPSIFVGVEGKYLWTDKAKLRDEAYGIPLEARFKMDGIIATAVFGIRF